MKNNHSLLLVLICSILSFGTVSCQEDQPILGNPYVDAPLRALKMQEVAVSYRNIAADTEVTVDFGDGSAPVVTKGSVAAVHQYSEPSSTQTDGVYYIKVTANGQTVEKRILVYPLKSLSYAAKELKQPGNNTVWVMAHRANTTDKSIPENSLAAVRACIAQGFEIIEIDTHLTADGQVVVCHDQTINRTTNGSGDITKMTLQQIRQYKLKDRRGNLYANESIPTLEEFLKEARGKIYVNLDYSPRTASTAQVMEVVEKMDMMDQVMFYCNSGEKVNEVFGVDEKAHAYAWHSNYAYLQKGPGQYFVQISYKPGESSNVSASLNAGMILTVNMLDGGNLDGLLEVYPETRVIQSDISDDLVTQLAAKGLR